MQNRPSEYVVQSMKGAKLILETTNLDRIPADSSQTSTGVSHYTRFAHAV